MQSKRCSRCGEAKPVSGFFKRRASHDGLDPSCKECKHTYNRAYREAHREEISAYHRAYSRAYNRAYNEAHREEISGKKLAYHEAHKEELNSQTRKWRAEAQKASREVATRNGEPWTPAEDHVVITSKGTALEIAIELGRTTSSVQNRRALLRYKAVTA